MNIHFKRVIVFVFLLCGSIFATDRLSPPFVERSLEEQAKAFFLSFDLEKKPLTAEQMGVIAEMVEGLMKNMPEFPSAQYYTLLGDGNYYLGNLGESLLFWRCAQLRIFRSPGLDMRIGLVRSLLSVDRPMIKKSISDFIGLSFLPKQMKYMIVFICLIGAFFFFTFWLWLHFRPFLHLFIISICVAVGLLLALSWYEWIMPPRVLALKNTQLRGTLDVLTQKKLGSYELQTGEEAEVLAASSDKKWLRIRTATGQTGYVAGSVVGFIE